MQNISLLWESMLFKWQNYYKITELKEIMCMLQQCATKYKYNEENDRVL